ncbi:hypothetical protein L1887_20769 [Cichorium endivia]|nr:hypothetical protein L1887_20769 [Cichorium endivia]
MYSPSPLHKASIPEAEMAMTSSMEVEESEATNIYIPEEWSEAADTIACGVAHTPTIFICGPKNSGKSTFSRHLFHVLLRRHKRVAYLDTDVGQPEFTPPGCLSLTILDRETIDLHSQPERCFFFGDISSKRDPGVYLKYIFALYDHYHKHHHQNLTNTSSNNSGVPLIINTPGWVKGIGYDVLVDMLTHIAPSHVVNIFVSAKSKNLPSGTFWSQDADAETVTLIEINSAHQDLRVLGQKDSRHIRDLNIVKYFRQCFPSDISIGSIKGIAQALAAHPPYEVSMSAVNIKHLHSEVPQAELFYSLNATIVGLAVSSENLPHCVGLGIVRGVDTLRHVVYIITPVPQHILEDVDVLLQGFIQIPTCLLQVQGCVSPYMASNVLTGI